MKSKLALTLAGIVALGLFTAGINNVVYNWCDPGGLIGGHSSANWYCDIINNYFIKGATSANDNWLADCGTTDCWHVSGNYEDTWPACRRAGGNKKPWPPPAVKCCPARNDAKSVIRCWELNIEC